MRRPAVIVLVLLVVAAGASVAGASRADDTILNQMQTQDRTGDSGSGPDLASLTVTSYADRTISFVVTFANRDHIQPNETVQMFIDLDDNGTVDLNLSIWPTGDPSYLARWSGTAWSNIRQLPELVQTAGQFSIRLSLAELQGAGAVGVAPAISIAIGTWMTDPVTGAAGANPDDLLPDGKTAVLFPIQKPAAPPPASPPTSQSPPRLTFACVSHKLLARLTPGAGSTVSFVTFTANGTARKIAKPPYVATIPTKGKSVTVSAAVHTTSGTQTVRVRTHACS